MEERDEIVRKYYRWYEGEYLKIINLSDLKKQHIPWLQEALERFPFPYSSIWRQEMLEIMRYHILPRKIEYICSSFYLSRREERVQYHTTLGFLYSYYDEKGGKYNHEYVCACPTFRSADGEYRHRFIGVDQLLAKRTKYREFFDLLERHFSEQINAGSITLTLESALPRELVPRASQHLNRLKKEIESMRLFSAIYASCWLVDYYRMLLGRLENHLAEGYKEVLFAPDDAEIWSECVKLGYDAAAMHRDLSCYGEHMLGALEVGQKFIQLTINHIEDSNNIQHKPWREMYVTSLVGDLTINGISPSFPIFGDWFFIQNSSPFMYNSRASHQRRKHSEIASEIVKKLENARMGTYVVDPIKKRELYLSLSMQDFSETIEVPMDYAEQELVLSDITLCSLNEHVGRTLADLPALYTDNDYARDTGPLFADFYTFSLYIFESIYAVLSLHTRLNAMHSDLHLNNITLFLRRRVLHEPVRPITANPQVIFQFLGRFYIFPYYGRHLCLIDYSRAILGMEQVDKAAAAAAAPAPHVARESEKAAPRHQESSSGAVEDSELHPVLAKFARHGGARRAEAEPAKAAPLRVDEAKRQAILGDQQARLRNLVQQELPEFYEANATKVIFLIMEHYETAFAILSALDYYKVISGWTYLLDRFVVPLAQGKNNTQGYSRINGKVVTDTLLPFLREIRNFIFNYLMDHLTRAFKQLSTPHLEKPSANCGQLLIERFFDHALLESFRPPLYEGKEYISVVDFFNYDNALRYNIRSYDEFPPVVKWDYILEHKVPVDQMGFHSYEAYQEYLQREKMDAKVEAIREENINNKPARRGSPMALSKGYKPTQRDIKKFEQESSSL